MPRAGPPGTLAHGSGRRQIMALTQEAAMDPLPSPRTPSAVSSSGAPWASDGDPRAAAMSALLAQNWWAVALRGVFAILFGLIALVMPGITIASLVLLFAAYMLVDGIFAIVSAARAAARHER